MPEGAGGVGGMAEKVVPFVNFPVLMRTVVPGLTLCLGAAPYCYHHLHGFPHDLQKIREHQTMLAISAALAVLIAGTLWSTLGNEIYKLYEGRTYWPAWLFGAMRRWEHSYVSKLNTKENELAENSRQREELWEELRLFPIADDGTRYAAMPTRLGNILRGYEHYPLTRYAMDGVFYWPRLWLTLNKDMKKEIEDSWSVADGLLMTSAALALISILWAATTLLSLIHRGWFHEPYENQIALSLLASVGVMVLSYIFYRVSLPFHIRNGETFKSLFDLFRSNLKPMVSFDMDEAEQWIKSVYYLQYLYFRCPECRRRAAADPQADQQCYRSIHAERCFGCNTSTATLLREVFPKQAPVEPAPAAKAKEA